MYLMQRCGNGLLCSFHGDDCSQAAGAIAELARMHATDQKFKSPYTREALKQGFDVPWWEKITTASFDDGKFQLGTLTVRL